mmetsp:Transcript_23008/g.66396  ORF Transcript_23008/g.66396 Transcript_23008/m.66396 type:complete len:297 (+) Transcript_23008:91-981(+)
MSRFRRTSKRRPSSFAVGLVILLTCYLALYLPLRAALIDVPSSAPPRTSSLLAWLVLIASFLNSVSHTAVILNLLKDTMIISILIGVSFDVLSEVLYILFWGHIHLYHIALPKSFVTVYAAFATYHLIVHVRALLMTRSFRRLESVVRSAYHNIIGYPGDHFYVDHIFAFSDTAFHLFHLSVVALHVIGLGRSFRIIGAVAIMTISLTQLGVGFAERGGSDEDGRVGTKVVTSHSCYTLGRKGDQPICHCKTCQSAGGGNEANAFCIRIQGGFRLSVCDLWQKSFREALVMIDDCK